MARFASSSVENPTKANFLKTPSLLNFREQSVTVPYSPAKVRNLASVV